MSQSQNPQTQVGESSGMNRRAFMRRGAAGSLAVAGVSYGSLRLDHGPVQNAQAHPLVPVAIAAGAVGWMLYDNFESIAANFVPDDLSEEVLMEQITQRIETRKSVNQSTFIDNKNIVKGSADVAYAEAKIAAIDRLNEGSDQSTAQEEGLNIFFKEEETILSNFFASWDESVLELDHFNEIALQYDERIRSTTETSTGGEYEKTTQESITLDDGETTIEFLGIYQLENGEFRREWDPTYVYPDANRAAFFTGDTKEERTEYLWYSDWNEIYVEIRNSYEDARNDFVLWLDEAYGALEAGDIDTTDLLSPREVAELMPDDEEHPRALADLQALNVAVDIDREAHIEFTDADGNLQEAHGLIGFSGEGELSTGVVVPSELDGTIYFTLDTGVDSTNWETVIIDDEFEILSFTGPDGTEYDQTNFSRRESQSDGNYLTQEEFDEALQRQLDLIDQSQQGEGGVAAGSFADGAEGFLSSEIFGIPVIGWAIGLAGAGILFGGND